MRDLGLSKVQQEILENCRKASVGSIVTIGGIDYNTLNSLCSEEDWVDDMLESEYPFWLVKISENTYQAATFSCYPPEFTEEELMEMITKAEPIATDLDEIRELALTFLEEEE